MTINNMNSDIRSGCEEIFYALSAIVDKDTAEKLAPVVLGIVLNAQKQVYVDGLENCDVGLKYADKLDRDEYSHLYADGIRVANNTRRNTYTREIERLTNTLELLKLKI